MLYDSLDDIRIESPVQSPINTFKRSLSHTDTTQFPNSMTTWYQQICPSPEHIEQGIRHP